MANYSKNFLNDDRSRIMIFHHQKRPVSLKNFILLFIFFFTSKLPPKSKLFFSMNNHYDLCDRYENQADESRKILGEVETHKNRVEAKCQYLVMLCSMRNYLFVFSPTV